MFLYLNSDFLTLFRDARLPFIRLKDLNDPFLENLNVRQAQSRKVTEEEIKAEIWKQYQSLPAHLAELASFDYFLEQAMQQREQVVAKLAAKESKPTAVLSRAQLSTISVCQFFQDVTNLQIWQHYGNRGCGIVIELNGKDDYFQNASFQGVPQKFTEVSYRADRPVALDSANFLIPALCRPESFAYERELRLFRPVNDKMQARQKRGKDNIERFYHKFPVNLIVRVILGPATSANDVRELGVFLKNDMRYKHLLIQQCLLDESRYEYCISDISPSLFQGD
ncbi:hypothetical protein OLMES_4773 [Oleiphilus messinensis]|uniref:DUF2971 domain-containing protein n=1 Tax=Oleiphilus messinensis TaxID=141451 RepID=A0A1Y0IE19_9GAMM|nr:DUF2971 domain-containing protein [Oleiphilus messinensis]ARU58762.1 hypothetical protein OLMES_4773 [Oleiphilus messinensis]